jgi:phosphoenolpyruvate synthase/pyruvate phosphate dikinase
MFLGERRQLIEDLILAESGEDRQRALAVLETLQTGDFVEILTAMDGLPVIIRTIDPPLHARRSRAAAATPGDVTGAQASVRYPYLRTKASGESPEAFAIGPSRSGSATSAASSRIMYSRAT